MYYRPPSENKVSLGEALDRLVKEMKLKPRMDELRIKQLWNELMGAPIAKHTDSLSFKGGKLTININSPALKNELYYSRSKIKDLINKEMGSDLIKEVLIF